jgi:hypothetical protein
LKLWFGGGSDAVPNEKKTAGRGGLFFSEFGAEGGSVIVLYFFSRGTGWRRGARGAGGNGGL